MKGNKTKLREKKEMIQKSARLKKMIIFIFSLIISYLLLVGAVTPQKYSLNVGDIPRQDIKAPRDIVDEAATAEKEDQAAAKVDEQYNLKTEVKKQADDNINELFSKLTSLSSGQLTEEQKIQELKKISGISLSDEDAKILIAIPKGELSGLESKILDIIDKIYKKNVGEDLETEVKPARKNVADSVEALNLDKNVTSVLSKIAESQINTNIFYDDEKTSEMRKEAQKNVAKVMIKQNQIIVKEGVQVTQQEIDILSSLGMLDNDDFASSIQIYLILAVFIQMIMFLQYNFIHRNYPDIYDNNKKLTMISSINLLSLILARAVGAINPFLIPFACAPMLLTMLVNYKLSLVVSTLNIILISPVHGFDVQILILGIICSILGATLLKNMQQRNELIYSTVYIAIVNIILTIATGMLISNNTGDILTKSGLTGIGAILAGIFAIGLLPFIEGTFNEVTILKLVELSNPNNVLLKKLLMDAPGTYHHSMMVANLAERAADEIGANSIIVRIGSYFHDIGKTERPYFFAENQMNRKNPHDFIEPNISAKIILSHVTDGLDLAKKYNLPKVVQDIIAEHHGTTLVKYFYYTMKNNSENPDEIKEEDYRYHGPIPSSKESAIIMVADSVEAAVRSIKEPTEEKINEMIENIIKDKLSSGQLNNSNLTINDIEKIKQCFKIAMNGIYHHRVEYPKDNTKLISSSEKATKEEKKK